jgi:hypothetical protein
MFHALHLGRRIRPITRPRRSGAALAAASLALGALAVVTAPAAQANLTAMSGTFNAAGFPTTYTGTNGVRLELCLDTPQCLGTSADMVAPDGEAFYYHASAELPSGVVGFVALEAAFLDQEPIVFQRTQVDAPAGVFQAGAPYTITDPYGSYTCVGNDDETIRTRCRIESGGGVNVFSDAITGRIDRFLVSATPPPGHIGNAVSPTPVAGGATFSVSGPGVVQSTTSWIIQGRLGAADAALAPGATTSVPAVDFGGQPVDTGASAARTVTLRSSGNTPLSGIAASTGSAEFPMTSTCAATLAVARECTISVGFDPAAAGPRAGVLTIASSAGNRTVPLTGRGQVGSLAASPSPVNFGNVVIDRLATKLVTVRNAGDASMAFTGAALSGSGAGFFGLGGAATPRCVGGTALAPGASCQIGVTFRPTGTGGRSASMQVTAGGTTQVIAVTGNGITEAQASDQKRPTVASRTPGARAKRVSRRADIEVTFTEAVQGVGTTTFKVINTRTHQLVTGRLSRSGRTWRLDPGSRLAAGTKYRVKLIGGSSAIRDIAGNALASQRWSFTTRG